MTDTDDANERANRIATSVRDHLGRSDTTDSRRGFLQKSLLAGGGLLALGGGSGLAAASSQEQEEDGDEGPAFDDVDGTDVDVLNYALSLEHLEDAFYDEALNTFDVDDFHESDALSGFSEDMRASIYEYVQVVGEHEATHVEVLSTAVGLLGGEPAQAGEYDFGMESVEDFVTLGAVLENTGVAAYAGAAPFIESPDLLGSALSIHSVEARHAAVFNRLSGESPFPNAFDEPARQDDVLEAVSGFIADSEADDDGMGEDDGENGGNGGSGGNGENGGNGESGDNGDNGGSGDGGESGDDE